MSKKVLHKSDDISALPEGLNSAASPVIEPGEYLRASEGEKLVKLSSELFFTPSHNQQKLKAKFWARFNPGPLMNDFSMLTHTQVSKVANCSGLEKWWREPGFKEWFLNRDETRERLSYLFNKSLDTLEQILDNEQVNPNARVNAVKLLAEMTGYLVKRGGPEKFADQEIENMSENQLKQYLEKKGVRLVEEKIIETNKTSE